MKPAAPAPARTAPTPGGRRALPAGARPRLPGAVGRSFAALLRGPPSMKSAPVERASKPSPAVDADRRDDAPIPPRRAPSLRSSRLTGPREPPDLAPFAPPASVLSPPPRCGSAEARAAGSAAAHAEAAALAERVLTSMRVGRVGPSGHEVHMRVLAGAGVEVEVRLRHDRGRLSARVLTDATGLRDARCLADGLAAELTSRGVVLDDPVRLEVV